jgi:hypothetical protein
LDIIIIIIIITVKISVAGVTMMMSPRGGGSGTLKNINRNSVYLFQSMHPRIRTYSIFEFLKNALRSLPFYIWSFPQCLLQSSALPSACFASPTFFLRDIPLQFFCCQAKHTESHSEDHIMFKKRQYIKSGKFSKKNLVLQDVPILSKQTRSISAAAVIPQLEGNDEKKADGWTCKM